MCVVELCFSGGTLAGSGDLKINQLSNSRHLWKVFQDIGFPRLDIQVKLKTDESVVVQNSRRFHKHQTKKFVVPLKQSVSQRSLDELQRIIDASDAELYIVRSNESLQRDKPRTHRRRSKSRTRR
jgi:hypothetical protein